MVYMSDKIDIHNSGNGLKRAIEHLNKSSMSKEQKADLLRLIELMKIGKAGKKKVGNHRIASYIANWFILHNYFQKDFNKVTEKEGEKFYNDIENNIIKRKNGKDYKPSSKNEIFKALKRYLKWSLPNTKYVRLVGWIKEYKDIPEIRAINLKEAEAVIEKINNPRDKALFFFLFDSGCRIEEALNLRIKSIEKKVRKDGKGEYYLVDIKHSKTLPRRISIPLASKQLTEWLKEHPDRTNPEAVLFTVGYDAIRKTIRVYSKAVLNCKITPHILRHSSASYYCKKIDNPYKFCYRYGWKFGSKEANRYIDRELLGEEEQEKLMNVIENDRVQILEKQVSDAREAIKELTKTFEILNTKMRANNQFMKEIIVK